MSETKPQGSAAGEPEANLPLLSSAALLKGGRELLIEHSGELYRLRLTGKGKLILTK